MQNAHFPIIYDSGITEHEGSSEEPTALACMTAQDWLWLAEEARLVTYEKGEFILKQGEESEAIYIVEAGEVRIERQSGDLIARRGPGSVFGEISFLEGRGTSASVVADSTVDVSVIDKADVEALLDSMPDLAVRFYKTLAFTLAFRLREAVERINEISPS